MIGRLIPILMLALPACSSQPATEAEQTAVASEDDFAARVGAGTATSSAIELAPSIPVPSKAISGPLPAGADVFAVQELGDISGVNLGPRAGGCTFAEDGAEMMIAAGPADRALPGKGVVRIDGRLVELDTPPGGIASVKEGTTFSGQGFKIEVQRTNGGEAVAIITDEQGETKTIAGNWVCA